MPPRVFAVLPSTIASCQIGVMKPLSELAKEGKIEFRWQLETKAGLAGVHWADVIVFCRNTEPAYAHLLNEAVSTSKPIIFDIDDNFWDVPFDSDPELARYHRLPLRLQMLERYLRRSNLVRVYSPVMKTIVSDYNEDARLVNPGFDFNLLSTPGSTVAKSDSAPVQIIYATSRIVDTQYKIFSDAILRLLDTHGERIQLTIWGCQPSELAGHKGVKIMRLNSNYESFLREFSAAGFDVGLAPLEDTHFHRSKTNTKFRDYGACRIAGLYSDVPVYSDCVVDNETGLLVPNSTEGWYNGLKRLVEDRTLRERIKQNAYKIVSEDFCQKATERVWLEQIEEVLKDSTTYSINSNIDTMRNDITIRADFDGLNQINVPSHSPGERIAAGKLILQILTLDGAVLRDASSIHIDELNSEDEFAFSFQPIMNSGWRDFLLRFVRIPHDSSDSFENYWTSHSGYVRMGYVDRPLKAFENKQKAERADECAIMA